MNDITIDSKEEFVASCSDDGKVAIFGLCETTHDQIIEFSRPIKSVEFEPNFAYSHSFATGDTKVCLWFFFLIIFFSKFIHSFCV